MRILSKATRKGTFKMYRMQGEEISFMSNVRGRCTDSHGSMISFNSQLMNGWLNHHQQVLRYCSRRCQIADWAKGHRTECASIRRVAPQVRYREKTVLSICLLSTN